MTIPSSAIPPPDKSPGEISGAKPIESDVAMHRPSAGASFASYMQNTEVPKGGVTPMAPLGGPVAASNEAPTLASLTVQAKTAQDHLGVVGQQLQTPNLKLNRSQSHLLRNKLTNMQQYAHSVADKLGAEMPQTTARQGGVLGRFLGYINDGESQFDAIQQKLKDLSSRGEELNPGAMLLVQVKMSVAQQEIEFCSTLLSKVVSSITTLMGIQI